MVLLFRYFSTAFNIGMITFERLDRGISFMLKSKYDLCLFDLASKSLTHSQGLEISIACEDHLVVPTEGWNGVLLKLSADCRQELLDMHHKHGLAERGDREDNMKDMLNEDGHCCTFQDRIDLVCSDMACCYTNLVQESTEGLPNLGF
jgi:hypothetical protein